MKVSRSGYYHWLDRPESNRSQENRELTIIIQDIFIENRNVYGCRRIAKKLEAQGVLLSRHRIRKLMSRAGLVCKTKRRFKVTTDSKHNKIISPNLLKREFNVAKPDSYWVGDITYIPTKQGWLYLATVIDLYSRKIVGWSMASHMRAELVNNALAMALWKRKPPKGLVWHTDRGSQYASESHRNILKDHGITQSMSRQGDCWDNAVAESFFHTLRARLKSNFNLRYF